MLSGAFSSQFDSFNEDEEAYQDSVFDQSTGI